MFFLHHILDEVTYKDEMCPGGLGIVPLKARQRERKTPKKTCAHRNVGPLFFNVILFPEEFKES